MYKKSTGSYRFYFEKLEVWQLSIQLSKAVYTLTRKFPDEEKFGLCSQLQRASVSISSNLAEGSTRSTKKDQVRFTSIAFSSLMEVASQLYLSKELAYLSASSYDELRLQIEQLAKKMNNLRRSQLNHVKEPMEEYHTSNSEHLFTHLQNEQSSFFIHPSTTIDEGAQIGKGTKIWHFSHIMSKAIIGENCTLGQNVFIADNVVLGNNVKVQNNVSIYTGVICEDEVFLGPSVVFTNVINPRSAVNRKTEFKKTIVRKGATIGANATIICGNEIGQYAFVGAGTVVTKNVASYALVVGNPAEQIGWMSEYGHRLDFDKKGKAICPESGDKFLLVKNNAVQKII